MTIRTEGETAWMAAILWSCTIAILFGRGEKRSSLVIGRNSRSSHDRNEIRPTPAFLSLSQPTK
jgi:hypothetical protein